jgi:hypothetical protein
MNTLIEVIVVFAGIVSVYALAVATRSFLAVKRREYEAYKKKHADFLRLDQEVREAFDRYK